MNAMNVRDAANGALNLLAAILHDDDLPIEEIARLHRLERILTEIAMFAEGGEVMPVAAINTDDTAAVGPKKRFLA